MTSVTNLDTYRLAREVVRQFGAPIEAAHDFAAQLERSPLLQWQARRVLARTRRLPGRRWRWEGRTGARRR